LTIRRFLADDVLGPIHEIKRRAGMPRLPARLLLLGGLRALALLRLFSRPVARRRLVAVVAVFAKAVFELGDPLLLRLQAGKHGVDIHVRERGALVGDADPGNHLEGADGLGRPGPGRGRRGRPLIPSAR